MNERKEGQLVVDREQNGSIGRLDSERDFREVWAGCSPLAGSCNISGLVLSESP